MDQKRHILSPSTLRKFPVFDSLSTGQLKEIVKQSSITSRKAGGTIYCEGDSPSGVYLILKGAATIEREMAKGEKVVLERLSRYQAFGWQAIFNDGPRQESVAALKDSEFLLIDRAMILNLLRELDAVEVLRLFTFLNEHIRLENERQTRYLLERHTLMSRAESEKQRALTEMAAGVAHEINTPLGIINTAVSIMARELAEPREITIQRAAEIAESLELIRRNVDRAHQLVQDFKKVTVGQLSADKETLDISEVVGESINLMASTLKKKKIVVQFQDLTKAEQKQWVGYRGYLSQVMINFLTNADRYAYPNDVGGTIYVRLTMENPGHFRISVRDHGRGISPQHLPRIFEPFFTTGKAMGGSGLGLAIVHNLVVNALRGKISVKSRIGKGTEFIITLPRIIGD